MQLASLYKAAVGMNRLEQLAMNDSPIHDLHPMGKLITTVAYIAIVLSFPAWNISGLLPLVFYPVLVMSLSGTPYRPLLERLAMALPFSLMGGISNLIFVHGTAFYIAGVGVSYGMVFFVSILLKTLFSVWAVLVLIATTSFVEISNQLSALHMPQVMCLQLVMTYRYLSILVSEAVSMMTAYALRSTNRKGIQMKDMGSFLGQLILRSFDRTERIYQSMKCRGFNGMYHGKKQGDCAIYDWIFVGICLAIMLTLRLFNFSLFIGKFLG